MFLILGFINFCSFVGLGVFPSNVFFQSFKVFIVDIFHFCLDLLQGVINLSCMWPSPWFLFQHVCNLSVGRLLNFVCKFVSCLFTGNVDHFWSYLGKSLGSYHLKIRVLWLLCLYLLYFLGLSYCSKTLSITWSRSRESGSKVLFLVLMRMFQFFSLKAWCWL